MNTERSVYVTGAFDDIRSRHIRFLQEAAKLGPVTVLLWPDEMVRQRSGHPPKFPESERVYFLRAVRFVSTVTLISEPVAADALPPSASGPAVWAVESSEDNPARQAFCAAKGIEYHVIHKDQLAGFPKSPAEAPSESARKRVIVTGCYDWFHSGHVRFFEEASTHGDLYVVVGHDANIRLLKGEGRPLFPEDERRYVVGSIRFVKEALISTGHGWLDAEPEMQRYIRPHVYAVNEDGDVPEKREYCRRHGIEYLVLKRTPAPGLPRRSSTDLRGY